MNQLSSQQTGTFGSPLGGSVTPQEKKSRSGIVVFLVLVLFAWQIVTGAPQFLDSIKEISQLASRVGWPLVIAMGVVSLAAVVVAHMILASSSETATTLHAYKNTLRFLLFFFYGISSLAIFLWFSPEKITLYNQYMISVQLVCILVILYWQIIYPGLWAQHQRFLDSRLVILLELLFTGYMWIGVHVVNLHSLWVNMTTGLIVFGLFNLVFVACILLEDLIQINSLKQFSWWLTFREDALRGNMQIVIGCTLGLMYFYLAWYVDQQHITPEERYHHIVLGLNNGERNRGVSDFDEYFHLEPPPQATVYYWEDVRDLNEFSFNQNVALLPGVGVKKSFLNEHSRRNPVWQITEILDSGQFGLYISPTATFEIYQGPETKQGKTNWMVIQFWLKKDLRDSSRQNEYLNELDLLLNDEDWHHIVLLQVGPEVVLYLDNEAIQVELLDDQTPTATGVRVRHLFLTFNDNTRYFIDDYATWSYLDTFTQ